MMTRKLSLTCAAMLLSLALAACSQSADEPMPTENISDFAPPPAEQPTPEPTKASVPEAVPTPADDSNAVAITKPEAPAPVAPDQQMMDDASATGMTAHTSRGEPASNESTVVE